MKGYLSVSVGNNYNYAVCLAHRLVWAYYHGKDPGENIVHHIDGNGINNSPDNLVLVSRKTHLLIHNPVAQRQNPNKWYHKVLKTKDAKRAKRNQRTYEMRLSGMSNRNIADALGLTIRSVQRHIQEHKHGIKGRIAI